MDFTKTDGEFFERFNYFAFEEVAKDESIKIDENIRYIAVLSALMGCGGVDAFKEMLIRALKDGFPPEVVKEIVYQATDYLGYGKMLPFLYAANEVISDLGIKMPDDNRGVTTMENRLEMGAAAQAEIFGEHMRKAWKQGIINRFLAANCFGDYYTRKGLDLSQREIATFCFLMAQGGCEPQLTAHAKGNMNIGNDKELLLKIVLNCLPYVGYPRSLNAIKCVNDAAES